MLVLDATTKSVTALLSGAAATTNPDFTAAYADSTTSAFTPAANAGALNGTTPVDLVAAPAGGTQRLVRTITVRNRDTAAVTLTVRLSVSGTHYQVWSGSLAVGDVWQLDEDGISVIDSTGALKTTSALADGSVTFAKMQAVSANILLGNDASGTTVEEITCTAAGRAILDDADAAAQRATLGLAIETDVQAYDATLAALAAFNTNGIVTQTAADTFTGRTITGTSARISVSNGDGVSGNPTLDIDATYVGQTSITTLGTVSTGTWSATTVAVNKGGTGQTSYTDGQLLIGNTTGNTLTKATLTAGTGISVTNGGGSITIASTVTSGAPDSADYLVKTANASLSAERVVTDTATVTVDWATAGQAKFNVAKQMSITSDSSGLKLVGDTATPSSLNYYGTVAGGSTPGWRAFPFAGQAEMEAANDGGYIVNPADFKYHPGVAKGWINFNGTGTIAINASYNVSSISDGGTGVYTVTWDVDFSSANYAHSTSCAIGSGHVNASAAAAGSSNVTCRTTTSGAALDSNHIQISAFGDQ